MTSSKKNKTVSIKLPGSIPAGATVEIIESRSSVTAGAKRKPATLELNRSAGTFDTYISRLVKSVNPDFSISGKAIAVMDAMMIDLARRMCIEASSVAIYNNRKTITLNDAVAAVGLVLRGELAKKAKAEGMGANAIYQRFNKVETTSTSQRCNLHFPVPRVQTMLKAHTDLRAGIPSAIFITAALEYVASEILEMAAKTLTAEDKQRIMPRFIKMVIVSDRELSNVFAGANFVSG